MPRRRAGTGARLLGRRHHRRGHARGHPRPTREARRRRPSLAAWLADGANADPIVSRLLQPIEHRRATLPPSNAGAQPTPTPATTGTREDYLRQLEAVQRLPKGAQRAEAMASLRAHPWLTGG